MSPTDLFNLSLSVTAAAAGIDLMLKRRRCTKLRHLAAEWRLNYSRRDLFRLTPRVARHFPVPGAARIRVVDLIYGIEDDLYRYVFTAEYTVGIVSRKRRMLRAASFSEPRDHYGEAEPAAITLAPAHLSLIEQYRKLTPPCAAVKSSAPESGNPM